MGGGPGEAGPRGAQGKGLRGCLSPAGAERGLGLALALALARLRALPPRLRGLPGGENRWV